MMSVFNNTGLCGRCGQRKAARVLELCPLCLKANCTPELIQKAHAWRQEYGLPVSPLREQEGLTCDLCVNQCRISEGRIGFCGVRTNRSGRIQSIAPPDTFLAYIYYDPLPTNCCAAWFCQGSQERGVNLAVFLYGCNFDCLFCQNASHRLINSSCYLPMEKLVEAALAEEVRCLCFFGGSPEPQLPLALKASREILRRAARPVHICWEWNGAGHPSLVRQAAEISLESGGTVKFDLKAWSPQLGKALCGVSIIQSYENLSLVASLFQEPNLLTATTLLVPFYVDESEVGPIARFLAGLRPDFPYSLLVFHPDDRLTDLPVTPKKQVNAAYQTAKKYLTRVNLGNVYLL